MNDFFANIYEAVYVDPLFSDPVYDGQDYLWLGIVLIIIPLLWNLAFYKLWDPTPVKRYKWLIMAMFTSMLSVFLISFLKLFYGESLADFIINEEPGVIQFIWNLSLYNSLFSIPLIAIYSVIIKRFSINNINNPI